MSAENWTLTDGLIVEHLHRIAKAWNDPGVNPGYHRAEQERLLKAWPVLANAVIAVAQLAPHFPKSPQRPPGQEGKA